jgi:hypothetical protein
MIRLKIGEIRSKYFNTQKELAEFLGIKNTSKKSIQSRCRVLHFDVEFD